MGEREGARKGDDGVGEGGGGRGRGGSDSGDGRWVKGKEPGRVTMVWVGREGMADFSIRKVGGRGEVKKGVTVGTVGGVESGEVEVVWVGGGGGVEDFCIGKMKQGRH